LSSLPAGAGPLASTAAAGGGRLGLRQASSRLYDDPDYIEEDADELADQIGEERPGRSGSRGGSRGRAKGRGHPGCKASSQYKGVNK
jgi:hypothetical protein